MTAIPFSEAAFESAFVDSVSAHCKRHLCAKGVGRIAARLLLAGPWHGATRAAADAPVRNGPAYSV